MFWQGLKPSLKDISGYKFEQVTDFDKLQEHNYPTSGHEIKTRINPIIENRQVKSEMKEIKSMLKSLDSTVKELEKIKQTGNTTATKLQT